MNCSTLPISYIMCTDVVIYQGFASIVQDDHVPLVIYSEKPCKWNNDAIHIVRAWILLLNTFQVHKVLLRNMRPYFYSNVWAIFLQSWRPTSAISKQMTLCTRWNVNTTCTKWKNSTMYTIIIAVWPIGWCTLVKVRRMGASFVKKELQLISHQCVSMVSAFTRCYLRKISRENRAIKLAKNEQ